jgi:acetyl esterase/lipase
MDRSILTRPGPAPDETLRYGPLPDHVADIWLPREITHPLVVLIHGGFWRAMYDRVHTRIMSAALRDAGWPVAAVEYRREPGNPGACTEDIRQALELLPKEMPGRGVVLVGHSAGGHLALWAASVCPPDDLVGTVALAPVADLGRAHEALLGDGAVADFLGGAPDSRPDLDPVRLGEPSGRVVLVHGADDTSVPVGISESYLRAHPGARLVVVPGVAHFELIDPDSGAWPRVVAELAGVER